MSSKRITAEIRKVIRERAYKAKFPEPMSDFMLKERTVLAEQLLTHAWGGEKFRKLAQSFPDGVFTISNSVSIYCYFSSDPCPNALDFPFAKSRRVPHQLIRQVEWNDDHIVPRPIGQEMKMIRELYGKEYVVRDEWKTALLEQLVAFRTLKQLEDHWPDIMVYAYGLADASSVTTALVPSAATLNEKFGLPV